MLPALLGELTALIANYHAIGKDDHQQFAARIGLLNAIRQKADQYLQAPGANAVAKGGPKALDATNPGRLDPWIASLSRRAQEKAAYLAVPDNWVRSAKPSHKDPLQIMQDLVDRANSNARGDQDEPLLSPTPYAKMEKVDPFHRNIVFFVQDYNSVAPYHNNPMAVALNQWLAYRQATVGATTTFYEWLENHPICTGTPQVTPGFDQRYKNNVQKVDYNVALHPVHVVTGMGLYIDLGSGGGIQQLSTSIFPPSGKGIPGGCAFAWDRSGDLWVHEHASGFRHTSFTGGEENPLFGDDSRQQGAGGLYQRGKRALRAIERKPLLPGAVAREPQLHDSGFVHGGVPFGVAGKAGPGDGGGLPGLGQTSLPTLPRQLHIAGAGSLTASRRYSEAGMKLAICVLMTAGALWAADPDEAIQKHRTGVIVVQTTPGARVTVEQTRHEFWFGATLPGSVFTGKASAEDIAKFKEIFTSHFNAGVIESAFKWHDMEREPGQVNYATVDAMLEWADKEGILLRGHCIFWGVPQFVQPWVQKLDDAQLRMALMQRGRSIGARYRDRFAEYDLNNEMIHANLYEKRLGPQITKEMALWVKEGDPNAKLFVNDYDILTGKRLGDYVKHIRGLLEMGVPVEGIGVQGHLHGDSFDAQALEHALDTLAQFNLPIRITEFNFPGQRSKYYGNRTAVLTPEEEKVKAESLREYFRICFAHPAVTGILMWGFWEGANWIPQSSLYKRDWTPLPAAEAYRRLVFGDWWTKWSGTADARGRAEVRAFYGRHRVTVNGREQLVELRKSAGRVLVETQ